MVDSFTLSCIYCHSLLAHYRSQINRVLDSYAGHSKANGHYHKAVLLGLYYQMEGCHIKLPLNSRLERLTVGDNTVVSEVGLMKMPGNS